MQWLRRALQHDPLNGLFRVILGYVLTRETQYEQALDETRTVLEINEDVWSRASAHYVMADIYSRLEKRTEALTAAERAYEGAPWHPRTIGMLAGALAQAGQQRRADEVIAQLRNAPGANGVPMGMVQYHLTIGDAEGAVEWFEKAVEQREPLALVWVGDPRTTRVWSSPRWAALMRTMNLEL